jgi:hypothetical protein
MPVLDLLKGLGVSLGTSVGSVIETVVLRVAVAGLFRRNIEVEIY